MKKGLAFGFKEATAQLLQSLLGHPTQWEEIDDHITKHKFYYCNSICGRQKSSWPPALSSDIPR
jgi:hypothetical protein